MVNMHKEKYNLQKLIWVFITKIDFKYGTDVEIVCRSCIQF